MNVFKTALSALIMLFSIALVPGAAFAQYQGGTREQLMIEGFDVDPAPRLAPGNELAFVLYGTPGGSALVRINGAGQRIVLDEVEAGVYEGTYTIRGSDRITSNAVVTANLRVGNRIVSKVLDQPLLIAAARPPASVANAPSNPWIERFELDPPARLTPGEQLLFTLRGTPGGNASVRIAGVRGAVYLEELRAGIYEGVYVIKERDSIAVDAAVTATLRVGESDASANLGRSLVTGPTLPTPSARRVAAFCATCGVVEAVNLVEVNGDGGYIGKIAGGVLGGLLGSQVGGGRGKTAAGIAGAIGGVVVGNEVEKRVSKKRHYEVVTRLEGGGAQTISYENEPSFKVGDKVRVDNGVMSAN